MSVFRYFFLITFYILRFESESMIIVVIWKMVQSDTNYALPSPIVEETQNDPLIGDDLSRVNT